MKYEIGQEVYLKDPNELLDDETMDNSAKDLIRETDGCGRITKVDETIVNITMELDDAMLTLCIPSDMVELVKKGE